MKRNWTNRLAFALALFFALMMLMASSTQLNMSVQIQGVIPTANGGTGHNGTVVTALGTTGTVSMDFSLGELYTMTPTGTVTLNATNCATGKHANVIVTTSGTSSFTITPSTNFKGTALATGTTSGKVFGWSFVCNGTTAVQMGAATAAM